jgi:hypothetical protein
LAANVFNLKASREIVLISRMALAKSGTIAALAVAAGSVVYSLTPRADLVIEPNVGFAVGDASTGLATCKFRLKAYRQVKIIGVTKDCDCVIIPELPIELTPGSSYDLPIAVNLGHDWNGAESTRQLRLFTNPPSGEPIFLKIEVG